MKGSIIERNGSYLIRVSTGKDPQTGKYRSHWETLNGTKTQAQKRLRELLTELDKGTFIKPGKSTLGEYLNVWLSDFVKPNLAGRTFESYSYICNKYVIPALGRCSLVDLIPLHLQHLYAEKQKAGLGRTVRLIHVTLHKALKDAVKMGLVSRNVTDAVGAPKNKKHQMKTMTELDYHIYLEMIRDTEYYALFYTYLYTALRRNEALALRWVDLDLLLCKATVNRQMQYLRSEELGKRISFKPPKTTSSRRMIDLTPSNVAVLQEHREAMNKQREALSLPSVSDNDLVFCHWDGSPLLPDSVSHAWMKLVRRCGMYGIRLHDARHSHASIMAKNGVPVKVISERLGHANTGITQDLYIHTTPGMQRDAANKFDEFLLSKPTD